MTRLNISLLSAALAAAALSAAGSAIAADDTPVAPVWTFGGFATVGAVHADEAMADFTSNALKANGAGHTRKWSGDVDSRVGAQLGVAVDKQWSAVLQVISEQGIDNSYAPIVEWANVKYQATPDLSVRVGRIALPIFLAADYRKATYALPWVRVPVELYGSIPISNSDGIDASYRWNLGDVKQVTQAFYGHTSIRLTDTAHAKGRDVAGVTHSIDYGPLTVRASMMRATVSVDLARPLFDAFRLFGPQGAALADRYDLDRKRVTGWSLGANYDPGQWFLMGEVGRINARSFLGDKTALYVSSGYRQGSLTPYLVYAQSRSNGATRESGLPLAGPAPLQAAAAQLNGRLNGLLSTIGVQTTVSAGLRWDYRPDQALKIQYDRVMPRDGSSGMLINAQPGFQSDGKVNVVSVSLDVVF